MKQNHIFHTLSGLFAAAALSLSASSHATDESPELQAGETAVDARLAASSKTLKLTLLK